MSPLVEKEEKRKRESFVKEFREEGVLFNLFPLKGTKMLQVRSLLYTIQVTKHTEEGYSAVWKWNITSLRQFDKISL